MTVVDQHEATARITTEMVSVPRSDIEWLRDCSDREMRDGDEARKLATKWLSDDNRAILCYHQLT